MKILILTLAIFIGMQAEASAQHHKTSHHRKAHRTHRHRSHTMHKKTAGMHSKAQPSPYHGDDTPINDGQQKNKQRNLNYNTGQPVPSNNGK